MAPINSKQSKPNSLDSRTNSFDPDLYKKIGYNDYVKKYPTIEYGNTPYGKTYKDFDYNNEPAIGLVKSDLINRGLSNNIIDNSINSPNNRFYVDYGDDNKMVHSGISNSYENNSFLPYHQSIVHLKEPRWYEGVKIPFFMDHPAGTSDRTRRAATIERGMLANLGYMPNQEEQSELKEVYGNFYRGAGFGSEQEMNAYVRMMKQQGYSDREIMEELFPKLENAFGEFDDDGYWLYDNNGNYYDYLQKWEKENSQDPNFYLNRKSIINDLPFKRGYKSYKDYLDMMKKIFQGDITKRITQNYIPRQDNLALSMHMQNNPNHAPGAYDKWPLVMYKQGGQINKLKLISKRKI